MHAYASPFTHHGRLIRAAWQLGHHPHEDFQALRRWAHMLGFRGHFATKSRRYSTTLRALRTARVTWRRRQHRTVEHRGGNDPHRRQAYLRRDRMAHRRRRTLGPVGRHPRPRAPAHRMRRSCLNHTTKEGVTSMEKLLYRPKEAAQALGIGRATLYDLIRSGRLRSVKDGGMRFISLDALRDYIRQLEDQDNRVA